MKANKWPFRPDHITNDGDRFQRRNLQKLNGEGIISNAHLQGLQTRMCANLENPTTIVEFSPFGVPVRTDSKVLLFAMHPPCQRFRECTYNQWCLRYDNRQALLFSGLGGDPEVVFQELNYRVSHSNTIRDYQQDRELDFGVQRCGERPFFAYDCPLLGYRELLFPISFEHRVLGTFFVGQLCLSRKLDFIERRQTELFRDHPDYFNRFIATDPTWTVDMIQANVTKLHKDWVSDSSHVMSDSDYADFIERACRELTGLEKTLASEMGLQRERYVRRRIERRIRRFRNQLPRREVAGEEKWSLLWRNLENRLRELISNFAIRYFVVFGTRGIWGESASRLDVVAKSADLPAELEAGVKNNAVHFNLDRVPEQFRNKWVTTVQEQGIAEGIDGWTQYSPDLNLIRLLPVPFFPRAALVVLVGYHDWNSMSSSENQPGSSLSTALPSFYTVVLAAMSSVLAAAAYEKMEAALRIFGHETGQLGAGLDWLRESYLSNPGKLRALDDEKARDLCRDIQGYLHQLLFLSKQTKLLISVGHVERAFFLAYRELLFKWKDTYRLEAERKSLQFDVYYPTASDSLRREVYSDRLLLEQLVYNLVNNAVKYSHRGTKIALDCARPDLETTSPHILTVTDYGMEMEGGNRAYELYWQGANAAGMGGIGIGLFVARQIIEAHGGTITHICEKISDYNVPLLRPYLTKVPLQDEILAATLRGELDRLEASGEYGRIVAMLEHNRQKYDPTIGEIVASIRKKTWRVSFIVKIPAKR